MSAGSDRMLKFGLIMDGYECPRWQLDEIKTLFDSGIASAEFLLMMPQVDRLSATKSGAFSQYFDKLVKPRIGHLALHDATGLLRDVVKKEWSLEQADQIELPDVDFLLSFSVQDLPSSLLSKAQLGVWSMRMSQYSDRPSDALGFWEIFSGEPTGSVRLGTKLAGSGSHMVIEEAIFRLERKSLVKTIERTLAASSGLVVKACRRILAGDIGDELYRANNATKLRESPGLLHLVAFWVKQIGWRISEKIRYFFFYGQWGVGITELSQSGLLQSTSLAPTRWYPQSKNLNYVADPFRVTFQDSEILLVEEYEFDKQKGRISELHVGNDGVQLEPKIELDTHLSYPYLFEFDNDLYCVPESGAANNVTLYKRESDGSWQSLGPLIEGVEAYDATVFQHQDRWWMFFSERVDHGVSRLHGYYAETPLGDWKPHPLNPLSVDISSSRPGGRPFLADGTLIRPCQDSAVRYGGATTFMEVVKLTETQFAERKVGHVAPENGAYPKGFHTVCQIEEGRFLVDGYREYFTMQPILHYLKRRLGL